MTKSVTGPVGAHDGSVCISYFITGGTGFVGAAFLKAAALRNPNAVFYCLVRGAGRSLSPQARLAKALHAVGAPYDRSRYIAVEGDIEAQRLGMDGADIDYLSRRVQIVLHCAASIGFLAPFEHLKKTNVDGARRVAAFSSLCASRNENFLRAGFVSTAYAVGATEGIVAEDAPLNPAPFRNAYERSKCVAERGIHGATGAAPTTLFRPSMIIGAAGDECPAPGPVLSPSLALLATGHYPAAPVNPDCPMDFVPVDYVAQAIDCTLTSKAAPGTMALVSGQAFSYSLGNFIDLYNECRSENLPRFRAISAEMYRRTQEKLGDKPGLRAKIALFENAYLPYLVRNPRFENIKAGAYLARLGVSPADPLPVIRRIMQDRFRAN